MENKTESLIFTKVNFEALKSKKSKKEYFLLNQISFFFFFF
jgi:hypothetical protein